ncbi:MAG: ATP-binding protein [Candidatus Poribacteria bacterium]
MRANPGGYISPNDVIGRDELIDQLWRILERQSLILCSERRMGKTTVINKMIAEAPKEILSIIHNLEGIQTPLEFVKTVVNDVRQYLSSINRIANRLQEFLTKIGGTEIEGIIKLPEIGIPPWKELLTRIIEDLVENQDRMVILFWDEFPVMLYDIKKNTDENTALEILKVLRSLRHRYPKLRMVFTGSIGIHNVIKSLRKSGSADDPTNDMYIQEVLPLSEEYAQKLAFELLKGEKIEVNDMQEVAQLIAKAVDGIPHYIHHIIDQLKFRNIAVDQSSICKIIDDCLTDPVDNWHMSHYYERINDYY